MPSSSTTRKANQATAAELAVSVSPARVICDKNFSFSLKTTSTLYDDERDQIWRIFEENMSELYHASAFGWDPQKKKKEMFHTLSRFVIVSDLAGAGVGIVAYSIFRFEREAGQDVVYCYELQVSKDYRRFGLGRLLTQALSDIGTQWGMTKIMLTVFKANQVAMSFYKSVGFTIDEESPDVADYSILSRRCTLD